MKKICLVALMWALLIGAGQGLAASALEKDTILVGTESTFRPFEFRDPSGELVGFDVDVVRLLGEKLGKKVEFVDMAFDGLIPSLLVGRIDLIAAGMSATPERAQRIAFTQSYYSTFSAYAVVAKADDDSIASVEDLKGLTVAVQLGTIQDEFITSQAGEVGVKDIRRYQKTEDGMREILLGRADAGCFNGAVTKDILENSKDFAGKLKICFISNTNSNGMALGLSKEDPEFLVALDQALEELMASPQYGELLAKWELLQQP